MADASFIIELRDRVSGPAKRVAAGLGLIDKRFGMLRNAQGKFVKTRFDKSLNGIASATKKVGRAALKATKWITAAAAAAAAFGAAQTLKAGKFLDGLQFSLTRFLAAPGVDGARAAEKAIADVLAISNDLGLSFQEAGSNFKDFVSAGFTVDQSKNLLRFKADLLALGDGGAEAAERVNSAMTAIGKATATGRIEADQFNEILKNLPVTKAQVLKKLADLTGKSFAKLAKTDVTKLPIKELVQAFQLATREATGATKAGEIAAKRARETVGGAVDLIVSRVRNMPTMIAKGMGEIEGLLPLLNTISDALVSQDAQDAIKSIAEAMVKVGEAAVAAAPVVGEMIDAFGEGMGPGFESFQESLSEVASDREAIEALRSILVALAGALGTVAGALARVVGWLIKLNAEVWKAAESVDQAMNSMTASVGSVSPLAKVAASGVGSSIVDGLVEGILAGAARVGEAITSVAQGAIDSAKSALDIGSPSKVFEQLGRFTAEGFGRGLEGEGASIANTTAGIVTPDLGKLGARGSTNVNANVPVSIDVSGAGDPQAVANAVAAIMQGELADAFEQVAISINAGPGATA